MTSSTRAASWTCGCAKHASSSMARGPAATFRACAAKANRCPGGGKSSGLMSFLKIGDRAAGAIKSGGTTRRAAKMVVLDLDHPDIEDFITWKVVEEQKVAALVAGSRQLNRHLNAILKACQAASPAAPLFPGEDEWHRTRTLRQDQEHRIAQSHRRRPGRAGSRQLHRAHAAAGQARVTRPCASTNTTPIGTPRPISPSRAKTQITPSASTASSCKHLRRTATGIFTGVPRRKKPPRKAARAKPRRSLKARELWDQIAYAAWSCADPGVQFDTTVNEWHTCPSDGRINASNPCSEYMFLDDTACNLASLNMLKFYDLRQAPL